MVFRNLKLSRTLIAHATIACTACAVLAGCVGLSVSSSAHHAKPSVSMVAIEPSAISERVAQVDQLLSRTYKDDSPGAVVLILHKGRPVLRKAYGLADVASKQALDPNQLFRIGSVTKQFTAVAILKLIDEGKLNLQTSLRSVLPHATQDDRITIEHLLTHTSGLPNPTELPTLREIRDEALTFDRLIDLVKTHPAAFEPGTRYQYSNTGYMLLGAIIERVTAQRYGEFIAKRIFAPLGMNDTAHEGMERSDKRIVTGYRVDQGRVMVAPPFRSMLANSAGAIVSTADDLAKWHGAISRGELLRASTWQRALTPYRPKADVATEYGFGWIVRQLRGTLLVEHSGVTTGFSAQSMHLPLAELSLVLLTNQQRRNNIVTPIAERSIAILLGHPFPEYQAISLSPDTLAQFAGVYARDDEPERTIRQGADGLTMASGRTTVPMRPYTENAFFIPESTLTRYRFERDATGKVARLVRIGSDDRERVYRRK